jgi:hypothetical protein
MTRSWACDLVHPVPVAAGLLLVFNDHVFKAAAWPSAAVAGKLSDAAGMFLAPLVATALSRGLLVALGRPRLASAGWLPLFWISAIGAAFAALKLSPGFNGAVSAVWGQHVLDPTDLLAALPALALSAIWLRRRAAGLAAPDQRRVAVVTVLALACVATPAPRYARNYPSWELPGDSKTAGCARLDAWVSRSGKTGFGVTVRAEPAGDGPCAVRLIAGEMRLDDRRRVPATIDPAVHALVACQARLDASFSFDNNAAWNHGVRTGLVMLVVEVDGETHTWPMAAEHQLRGAQRERHLDERKVHARPGEEPPDCAASGATPDAGPLERAR